MPLVKKRDQRTVFCPKCDGDLTIGNRAQTIVCRHCNRTIDVQDYTIDQYFARKTFETCGDVVVEKKGTVRADMKVHRLTVRGKVYGKVIAREVVEIAAEGTLHGDIEAPAFVMKDGAIYVGRLDIHPTPEPERPA